MPSKSQSQNESTYTDPELRKEVKEEIHASDKGGKPGQWSARKAQLTAQTYKSRGGDYTTSKDEQKSPQENLSKWSEEDWQTKEGTGAALQKDGTRKRYLPRKAWEGMSEGEKERTERKKVRGGREGRQFVGNTGVARRRRGEVSRGVKGEENGEEGEDDQDEYVEDEDEVEEEEDAEEQTPKKKQKPT
ncbi:hypothetical protein BO70DRAFT_412052 [Aspergillus heteromorphus CBS 117.55]|uniref:DUF5872 domain-containing protein n=1 Tax=Aspergillus heteromorphus CBS 117.55 TaxID=1448321 RepID=A0A317VQ61_9EURO|nr:uncharacterized protein BO70DRAFT_412052 [Aspergillus heteromorphus CBS 117.55]PWY75002.1 hypothetical protein BO70DRAFT_412052 [Aspergillus heteromorphus CBS 117.55]